MSISCPRCNTAHDGKSDSRSWATCRNCAYVWQLNAKPKSEPAVPKPRADYGRSDEYAPLESGDQSHTAPLTVREGAQPSGKHPVISPLAPAVERKPRTPRIPLPPMSGKDLDSQLFDRMERQAQQERSNQETVNRPSSTALRRDSEYGTCPVCGHRFVLVGKPPAEMQTCPQCSTGFNLRNGQLASEGSNETTGGDPLIGRTIRGCFIDRKVGEGGMGSVYHARQLSLDRSVAIKVMPSELARNKNFIQRFEREAKSLARINHPNILHIYDFGEEQTLGIYFMIIEFVDGKDLGEILRARETISQQEMLDILRQALLGLEMASEKGVIHRDIKPDNLMIATDGTCKVSDFGLAKGYGAFDEVTTAGVRVGTPAFMSPEQCDGIEVDARSDVYSLGCTVYLALTGSLPFGGDSPFSIMLKHKTDPPPSLLIHRAEIDPDFDALVRRMLAKKPDDRCIKLHELISQVEDLQESLDGGRGRRATTSSERVRGRTSVPNHPSDPGLPPVPDLSGPPASQNRGFRAPEASGRAIPDLSLQPDHPVEPGSSSSVNPVVTNEEAVQSDRASTAVKNYQEAVRRRTSREAGEKSADARKQQRYEESAAIEARGDQFAADGRHDQAIDEWMRAAQVSSQVTRREDLLRKVGEIQSLKRKGALLRRSLGFLVLFIVVVVGGYLVTPVVHSQLAKRELAAIPDLPAERRLAALDDYLDRNRPYDWYVRLYRSVYTLPAVNEAEHQRSQLTRVAAPQVTASPEVVAQRERKLLDQLKARSADPQVTWKQLTADAVAAQVAVTDPARRSEVDAIANTAKAGLQKITEALSAIEAARQAGRHATALMLAAEFVKQQTRAGAISLPAIGRLEVTVDGRRQAIDDLRIAVDGVVLVDHPEVFCRDPARATIVEVSAPGYLNERRSIPPGSGETSLSVQLKPAMVWQVNVIHKGPWWSLESRDSEHVLMVGAHAFLTVRLSDGAISQSIERKELLVPPEGNDPRWTLFQIEARDHVLVATSDGLVARFPWDGANGLGTPPKLLRKGSVGVSAFLERELTLQPGRQVQLQVETTASGAELAAWSGQEQLWRAKNLVCSAQQPYLTAVGERICLVDDQAVRLYEEDGSDNGSYELASQRTAGVVQVGGSVLAIPTADGVELLRLGGQPNFLEHLSRPAIGKIGQASVAGHDDELLIADQLGGIHLYRVGDGGISQKWKTTLPPSRKPVGQVMVTATYAVVVDDSNSIYLFSRADGILMHRYDHAFRPVLAPLPVGQKLVVLNPGGQLTAYHLHD